MDVHPVDHTNPSVAEELLRLQRRAYAVEARLIDFDGIPNLAESVGDIQHLLLIITAAFDDDRIVGFIGHERVGANVEIDRLAVEPASFRCGIGRALLHHLHDTERDAEFVVSTPTRNSPAVALYTSMGYRMDGEHSVGDSLRVVRLRRRRDAS